jgi:hypothetical protein
VLAAGDPAIMWLIEIADALPPNGARELSSDNDGIKMSIEE